MTICRKYSQNNWHQSELLLIKNILPISDGINKLINHKVKVEYTIGITPSPICCNISMEVTSLIPNSAEEIEGIIDVKKYIVGIE